jgi:hypothetical protein
MSLNLLNPRVGDIMGVSSQTYETGSNPVMEGMTIESIPADCCGRKSIIPYRVITKAKPSK